MEMPDENQNLTNTKLTSTFAPRMINKLLKSILWKIMEKYSTKNNTCNI